MLCFPLPCLLRGQPTLLIFEFQIVSDVAFSEWPKVHPGPEFVNLLFNFLCDMPHATTVCDTMDEFVALHKVQLLSSGIPELFWDSLFFKLKQEVIHYICCLQVSSISRCT